MTEAERHALEEALVRAEQEADRSAKLHGAVVRALRLRLQAGGCTHPTERVVAYNWMHDNGYGRQTMIVGERCTLCLARRASGMSAWQTPEELRGWHTPEELRGGDA